MERVRVNRQERGGHPNSKEQKQSLSGGNTDPGAGRKVGSQAKDPGKQSQKCNGTGGR